MQDQYIMSLDAGGGAGRCFLVSIDGKKSISSYREWSYTQPANTGAMGYAFDPDIFWDTLAGAIKDTLAKAGIQGDQVVGVSSTSQREGCVFLDSNGVEVYAGPNRDYRAVLEGMHLSTKHGDEIYQRTGHYPDAMFPSARLLWHKNNAPDLYEKIAHLLMINDWVLFRLCGEFACEPSNASETGLFDLEKRDWTYDLIDELGLKKDIFPKILDSGTQLGVVSKRAADETGLLAGTPVVMGGADTQCGLLGCGALLEGDIAAISGTTTPVQMITNEPIIDPEVRTWAGAYVVPGLFVLESNAGYSGGVYQWFRDEFCQMERVEAESRNDNVYNLMNECAIKAPPGSGGVLSFIGIMRMNAKSMGIPKNVIYLGMTPLSESTIPSRFLLLRAILESLAYGVRANAEQVLQLSNRNIEKLRVCGGLANSDLYLEILANVMATPLYVPQWTEGSGIGAAICAGVGASKYRSFHEGAEILTGKGKEIHPDDRLSRQYKSFYRRWEKTRQELGQLSTGF
jgi:sugar (pentulose or hexulose) kinase